MTFRTGRVFLQNYHTVLPTLRVRGSYRQRALLCTVTHRNYLRDNLEQYSYKSTKKTKTDKAAQGSVQETTKLGVLKQRG